MRRGLAALAAVAAAATLGVAGAGAGRPPSRIVVPSEGVGHLPAYRGPENPPLGGAGAGAPDVFMPGPPAATPVQGPGATGGTTTSPASPSGGPDAVVALGVQVSETPDYVMRLSRASVPAGNVTVQLQNTGEDEHNVRIVRSDGTGVATELPDVQPGGTVTRTVRFTPGRYRLACTLTAPTSHDDAGMHATLTVTAS